MRLHCDANANKYENIYLRANSNAILPEIRTNRSHNCSSGYIFTTFTGANLMLKQVQRQTNDVR